MKKPNSTCISPWAHNSPDHKTDPYKNMLQTSTPGTEQSYYSSLLQSVKDVKELIYTCQSTIWRHNSFATELSLLKIKQPWYTYTLKST